MNKIESLDEYIEILKERIAENEEELERIKSSVNTKVSLKNRLENEIMEEKIMAERLYSVLLARRSDLSLIIEEQDNDEIID